MTLKSGIRFRFIDTAGLRESTDRIETIGRSNRVVLEALGRVNKTPISDAERKQALVEEFGYSAEVVERTPPDEDGSASFV